MEEKAHDDRHDENEVPAESIGFTTLSFKRRASTMSAWNLNNRIHANYEADRQQRRHQTDDLPFGRHMIDDHKKHKKVFKIFQNKKETRERTDATCNDADQRREHTDQHVVDYGTIDRGLANKGQIAIDDRLNQPTESDDHEQEIVHTQRKLSPTDASPLRLPNGDFWREQHRKYQQKERGGNRV